MANIQRYEPPSSARLLQHILEDPGLVAAVRELPAPVLGTLIDRIGLEDAGELVALASTEQLARVFDEDLWTSERAGEDPRFDPGRFAAWLQVMLEAGEAAVVGRICELPLDFVVLAVARLVLVVDSDALAVEVSEAGDEGDLIEKGLDSCLNEEWEEFRLIARDAAAWDSILQTLLALDREHHDVLRQILERCCFLTSEYIADNGGLYEVLTSDEMLETDVGADRDERRAAEGYVAPSDARAFLELARTGQGRETERDPVTRAYFRELVPRPVKTVPRRAASEVKRLTRLLLNTRGGEPETRLAEREKERLLDAALSLLREQHPVEHAARLGEIGYLANVLVSGRARRGAGLRPVEALEAAVLLCDFGLRAALAGNAELAAATALLESTPLDLLFRRAWRALEAKSAGAELDRVRVLLGAGQA
jgi:hypothetical protein